MLRIRKDVPVTEWLLQEAKWYHHRITFTNVESEAAQLTQEQADAYLALPGMPATAYAETIPE